MAFAQRKAAPGAELRLPNSSLCHFCLDTKVAQKVKAWLLDDPLRPRFGRRPNLAPLKAVPSNKALRFSFAAAGGAPSPEPMPVSCFKLTRKIYALYSHVSHL